MKEWHDFFVASTGAAAALTGLIFVGVSINLTKILSVPKLPNRALESLVLLLHILIISLLCLIPAQPTAIIGVEILAIGVIVWSLTLILDMGIVRNTDRQYKRFQLQNLMLTQLALLPFIAAGIIIISYGDIGVYWLVPGIIISFIKALLDAWVLLVEIQR